MQKKCVAVSKRAGGGGGGKSHNSDLSPANQRPANYSGSHCDSLDACHVLVATDHHPTGDNLSADRNRNARADITDSHCNQHAAPTVNHRSRACDHHSGAADIHAACLASRHHRPGSSADNHCAAINAVVDHHCAAGNNGYFADHRSGDRGNHNTRSPPHAHPSPAFQPTYPSLRDPRFRCHLTSASRHLAGLHHSICSDAKHASRHRCGQPSPCWPHHHRAPYPASQHQGRRERGSGAQLLAQRSARSSGLQRGGVLRMELRGARRHRRLRLAAAGRQRAASHPRQRPGARRVRVHSTCPTRLCSTAAARTHMRCTPPASHVDACAGACHELLC
mmetsp:Transcript_3478/g.8648  ORF Transcript_3478/g.8648 Transcript_3478/m.8648 type:complete len:335 (-) Transcript_3478:219-1223(-)